MKFIAEVIRDLTLLFWWALPGTAVNMRFYCLIFTRIVFYIVEATAFYAMTVTILAGTEDEAGFLVELTRLILCSAAEQMETRVKRGTEDWQSLVQQVNDTNSELAEILKDLFHTTTRHMGTEGRLYSSKSTNGGKGLKNSKINSYFTP